MAKKIIFTASGSAEDYVLAGISCHLRDYRFCFLVNRELGLSFRKLDDLLYVAPKKTEGIPFSLYISGDPEYRCSYTLLNNTNTRGILLPLYRQFDYLFIMQGEMPEGKKDELLKAIKNIENVLAVQELDPENIPGIENIMDQLELHLLEIKKENKKPRPGTSKESG